MGPPTKKSRVKCTCHRIHKTGMFRRKCKLHRHYALNTTASKRLKRKSMKKTRRRVANKPLVIMPKEKEKEKEKTEEKEYHVKGVSANSKKLLEAIHKIQKCEDLDQCGEIKNYISMNVCDPDSSNKDILFYYNHLSEKDRHTIYEKVTGFAKTI